MVQTYASYNRDGMLDLKIPLHIYEGRTDGDGLMESVPCTAAQAVDREFLSDLEWDLGFGIALTRDQAILNTYLDESAEQDAAEQERIWMEMEDSGYRGPAWEYPEIAG